MDVIVSGAIPDCDERSTLSLTAVFRASALTHEHTCWKFVTTGWLVKLRVLSRA